MAFAESTTKETSEPRATSEYRHPFEVSVLSSTLSGSNARSRRLMEAVSVVVSIRMRKMFTEVRKMFLDARLAEQDVR